MVTLVIGDKGGNGSTLGIASAGVSVVVFGKRKATCGTDVDGLQSGLS